MDVSSTENYELDCPPVPQNPTKWDLFKWKLQRFFMISEDHPYTLEFFRSEVEIFNERRRHYEHYKYVIHPLSKFKMYYDIWLLFFYGVLLFAKSFDFGFVRISEDAPFAEDTDKSIVIFLIILDILSIWDILVHFLLGYYVDQTHQIELSHRKIAKRYIISGVFICDIFSSIPKIIFWDANPTVYLIVSGFPLLKLRRVPSYIVLMKRTLRHLGITSTMNTFLLIFFYIVFLIIHVMACCHAGLEHIRLSFIGGIRSLSMMDLTQKYLVTFFRCSQNTLLISVPRISEPLAPEEFMLETLNYALGKVLVTVVWIVLLHTFMYRQSLKTKFEEVMTELNEYLAAKLLPMDVRKRMVAHYTFKYQKMFFNEGLISTVLSQNLKLEIDAYLCKSLIKQIKLFSLMPPKTVQEIVAHLVPEIFLANDRIIQPGATGDCIYFIESGTVAIFTPSGREVCHLYDGAFFGETSIVMRQQKRITTVIAIESSKLYKLKTVHFDRYFDKDSVVYGALLEAAEKRIKETRKIEERFKRQLEKYKYDYSF